MATVRAQRANSDLLSTATQDHLDFVSLLCSPDIADEAGNSLAVGGFCRLPSSLLSYCLKSGRKLWRTLCRNPRLLCTETRMRPGAVPCVKRKPNSLSSPIFRCRLLLILAKLCIIGTGIDTVEVWGSSPHEPTIPTFPVRVTLPFSFSKA